MRALVALYFAIGIALLAVGFLATGPCETPNKDAVNDGVFVLTWPVSVYGYVIVGRMSPTDWLHNQACAGGLGSHPIGPAPPPPAPPAAPPKSLQQ